LSFGLPMLVLPFSTDQFAGAAAIERAGVGVSLAPNDATVAELANGLRQVLAQERATVTAKTGAEIAYSAVTGSAVL
jgi:zeaxanthin glucosyltransferase